MCLNDAPIYFSADSCSNLRSGQLLMSSHKMFKNQISWVNVDCHTKLGGGHTEVCFLRERNWTINLHFQLVNHPPCDRANLSIRHRKAKYRSRSEEGNIHADKQNLSVRTWADSNRQSPVYKTGALTTMLPSLTCHTRTTKILLPLTDRLTNISTLHNTSNSGNASNSKFT